MFHMPVTQVLNKSHSHSHSHFYKAPSRIYNRTINGRLYEGNNAEFHENPSGYCKKLSYVVEIGEGKKIVS